MRYYPWSYMPAVFVIVSIAQSSMGAPTYFTDRASFDAATAGGILGFEGFEDGFENSRPPGYNPFNGFALLSGDREVYHATENGGNSFSVTQGIDSLWFEDSGSSVAQFGWGSSIHQAFGLDITFAQGHGSATTATMTIGGAGSGSIDLVANVHQFWGVVDPAGIDPHFVTFDVSGNGNIGFDAVSFERIPEPASISSLALAAILVGTRYRRRALLA